VDCNTPLERIVARCVEAGINCLAVSDHNTTAGAVKLKEIAPFKVIVAEEIMTSAGELMGLFLTEEIAKGLSPEETISMVKSQGGLVGIPHPFGRWPLQNQGRLLSQDILSHIDIIEVFNSRSPLTCGSRKVRKIALQYGLLTSAGSDAHSASEIGRAFVEMPDFNSPGEFRDSLAQGQVFGHRSNPFVHLASIWAKIRKSSC